MHKNISHINWLHHCLCYTTDRYYAKHVDFVTFRLAPNTTEGVYIFGLKHCEQLLLSLLCRVYPNFTQSKNYTIAIAWNLHARFSMSFEQSVRNVTKHNRQLYCRAEKVITSTTHTSHWECNYEANGLPSLRGSYAVADDDEDADDGAAAGDAGSAGDWGENRDFVVGGRRYWSWARVRTSGRSSFL